MYEIVNFVIIVMSGGLAMAGVAVAYRLWQGDSSEYDRNRERVRRCTWRQIFEGRVPAMFGDGRDYRIAAGLAVDRRKNEWVEQGRLSDEAVSSIFRRPNA